MCNCSSCDRDPCVCVLAMCACGCRSRVSDMTGFRWTSATGLTSSHRCPRCESNGPHTIEPAPSKPIDYPAAFRQAVAEVRARETVHIEAEADFQALQFVFWDCPSCDAPSMIVWTSWDDDPIGECLSCSAVVSW